ncbi:MAG: hypothetical protein KJ646_02815 [Nanoarchaeota archaeon]|nr:hypothetical protein [Nanoarchaeota archaeon]MBU4116639.1 hypothetical protein [Nanoarchaeota archaeon]
MLKSKKHVFWEALFVTVIVFITGLLIGISFEKHQSDIIENYYAQSEVSLVDIMVLQKLSDIEGYDCDVLINANMEFADKIYFEALLLQEYESASRIVDDLVLSHKKYDLLRTFVWANALKIFEKCSEDFTPVIYLYEQNTEDLAKKATQKVWSRILEDLKYKKGNEIILLPIAADNNLSSVNAFVNQFEIKSLPCVVVGKDVILYELTSEEAIESYLN